MQNIWKYILWKEKELVKFIRFLEWFASRIYKHINYEGGECISLKILKKRNDNY